MEDIKQFILMRDTANYAFANEAYELSSQAYEKAYSYSNSLEMLISASLAYIKLGLKGVKRDFYLSRALSLLDRVKRDDPIIKYYRGLVLYLLGNEEGAFDELSYVYQNIGVVKDLVIPFLDRRVPKNYIESYLSNDDLKEVYDKITDYLDEDPRIFYLLRYYGELDKNMARARELKRLYKLIYEDGLLNDFLWTNTAKKQALAYLYLRGDNKRAIEDIKKNSYYFFISTENLPPIEGFILDNVSGIYIKKNGFPFFVKVELEKLVKLRNIISSFLESSNIEEALLNLVDFVSEYKIDVKPITKKRVYREDIFNYMKNILRVILEKLHLKLSSYYSSYESLSIIKSILEAFPLAEKEKEEIIRKL